ncbi:hypothetical protein FRB90_002861 [Tulasnella sp. 427]|nr:hypothetical protein FRB90_002861 [Tulasnella sp. 427]
MKFNSNLWPVVLTLDPSAATSAAAAWDCKVSVQSASWDLTSLGVEKIVTRTRSSPPSEFVDEVRWNICNELKEREGYDAADQCPAGTLACLTETNKKPNDGGDRITAVIPLAVASDLKTEARSLQCSPKFVSFDRVRGVVDIEWSVPAACPLPRDGDHDEDNKNPPNKEEPAAGSTGGGVGWFFLVILLALLGYFGLGAYYNYNNYGSTGWDLIPHRDFWREVPYLVEDLVSYMFSSVRSGGGSRGGYVSV